MDRHGTVKLYVLRLVVSLSIWWPSGTVKVVHGWAEVGVPVRSGKKQVVVTRFSSWTSTETLLFLRWAFGESGQGSRGGAGCARDTRT